MSIPSAEGLRALPDSPQLNVEEQTVAAYMREHQGAVSLEAARAVCAAEYGFASWENLVGYFRMCEAHTRAGTSPYNLERERADGEVESVLKEINSRKDMTEPPPDGMGHLAAVSTYVPRLYGLSNDELTAVTLTESEAQLTVARERRFMNWGALSEKIAEMLQYRSPEFQGRPQGYHDAQQAVRARNIEGVTKAFSENPKWFGPVETSGFHVGHVWEIIKQVIASADAESRALLDHLYALGVDVQSYLDSGLLGTGFQRVDIFQIRGLLALGANPHWMPRNGHSVLEHAIVRYMNGEAVDLIASHVKQRRVKYVNDAAVDLIASHVRPRRAFWISAGLGDVETMLSFIGSDNRPTVEARSDRFDTNVFGLGPIFSRATRPNVSDTEILWEAFMLAGLNGRIPAMDALLNLGFPVNYAPGPENMLVMSVRHHLAPVVEYLLSRGADPHYKSWPNHWSAVHMSNVSREHYADKPGVAEIHAMLAGAAFK